MVVDEPDWEDAGVGGRWQADFWGHIRPDKENTQRDYSGAEHDSELEFYELIDPFVHVITPSFSNDWWI